MCDVDGLELFCVPATASVVALAKAWWMKHVVRGREKERVYKETADDV